MERVPTDARSEDQLDESQRSERLLRVQQEVAQGEYVVNSQNVAAAILERIGATFSEDGMVRESRGGHALWRALTFPRGA